MILEERFYKSLRDVFIGTQIEGQGVFVKLMRIKSDYHHYGFDSFIGSGSNWEYGLVIDLMESPRAIDKPDTTVGLHLQILKDGQLDWVFNFEYLDEIQIVGFLDEEYEKHNT